MTPSLDRRPDQSAHYSGVDALPVVDYTEPLCLIGEQMHQQYGRLLKHLRKMAISQRRQEVTGLFENPHLAEHRNDALCMVTPDVRGKLRKSSRP